MLNIDDFQELCYDEAIVITKHARQRLRERNISIENVQNAIRAGEIIKQYEDDTPFPSCLLMGNTEQNECIHVIASTDNKYLYLITAYYPNESEWEADFKTRKGKSS